MPGQRDPLIEALEVYQKLVDDVDPRRDSTDNDTVIAREQLAAIHPQHEAALLAHEQSRGGNAADMLNIGGNEQLMGGAEDRFQMDDGCIGGPRPFANRR